MLCLFYFFVRYMSCSCKYSVGNYIAEYQYAWFSKYGWGGCCGESKVYIWHQDQRWWLCSRARLKEGAVLLERGATAVSCSSIREWCFFCTQARGQGTLTPKSRGGRLLLSVAWLVPHSKGSISVSVLMITKGITNSKVKHKFPEGNGGIFICHWQHRKETEEARALGLRFTSSSLTKIFLHHFCRQSCPASWHGGEEEETRFVCLICHG